MAAKLNQARFDGQLNDALGFLFAPGAVNTRDEITECQLLLWGMNFHGDESGK
ncbi:MAG: hypothetical protein ABSG59_07160 [Verrucomicrobiota bacterium]